MGTAAAGVEVAHAVGKAAAKSPRVAVLAFSGVAALAVVLAFAYLLVTRPATPTAANPIPTSGDWMTRSQFREELDARDARLSPATNSALSEVRSSIEALRAAEAANEKVREERARSMLDTLARIESRFEAQGARIDALYRAQFAPGAASSGK